MILSRRDFIVSTALAAAAGRQAASPSTTRAPTLRLNATGQALILRDLESQSPASFNEMRQLLSGADVSFTDLEAAIRGPRVTQAISSGSIVATSPLVLNSLRQLGFNLLALSNNHAADLGQAGILSTIEETTARGFVTAGIGRSLTEAARPGLLAVPSGRVALIAMASGAVLSSSIASPTQGGVHHVAQQNGVVDAADRARVIASIRAAAKDAHWVVVYQHDHYWAPDWQETPDWKKAWCRDCIDAGATAFISHGVPILHGIEIYKGRPIFYGLGNFIFHIAIQLNGQIPARYIGEAVFQSVVAQCAFEGDKLRSLQLHPVTLKSTSGVGEGSHRLHGNPQRAVGAEAAEILARVAALSRPYGTVVNIDGAVGTVKI